MVKFDLVLRDLTDKEVEAVIVFVRGADTTVVEVPETPKALKGNKADPKPKKVKKEVVKEQEAEKEADDMFGDTSGETDELGLDESNEFDEPAEPVLTHDDAIAALQKFVEKLVKSKKKPSEDAKLEARKLLSTFGVKSVKDLDADQIAQLVKKVG